MRPAIIPAWLRRVLLVYSNQSRDLLPAPPIGLCHVARATCGGGHDVRVLDLLKSRQPRDDLRDSLRGFAP